MLAVWGEMISAVPPIFGAQRPALRRYGTANRPIPLSCTYPMSPGNRTLTVEIPLKPTQAPMYISHAASSAAARPFGSQLGSYLPHFPRGGSHPRDRSLFRPLSARRKECTPLRLSLWQFLVTLSIHHRRAAFKPLFSTVETFGFNLVTLKLYTGGCVIT